jgi:MoxR-like ATPase
MERLVSKVCEKVVGRRNEILMIISALRAGKHLFLEGPPGTSKSTILRAISESGGTPFLLITGNSDLTTSKLVGYFDPAETISRGYRPEYFNPGPLVQAMTQGMYLYVEEFNRLPDETTNVFVTVMSENSLCVPRYCTVASHPNFRIVAALNPLDDIGISRISRALKDRFCSFKMDYQSRSEEIEIVKRNTNGTMEETIELAVDMARETRKHSELKLGASVRASIDMIRIYCEALNLFEDFENPNVSTTRQQLLLKSAMMAFRNRIWLYETCEKTPEEIIEEIFRKMQTVKKN